VTHASVVMARGVWLATVFLEKSFVSYVTFDTGPTILAFFKSTPFDASSHWISAIIFCILYLVFSISLLFWFCYGCCAVEQFRKLGSTSNQMDLDDCATREQDTIIILQTFN